MNAVVTPLVLRDAICEALWQYVRAQDLAEVCVYLGLAPQRDDENPFNSKRSYVRQRVLTKSMDELADLARKIVAQFDPPELANVVARLGAHGVAGDLKNLIFAADGPKPRIVLRDAISNVVEIVDNAEHCLMYDRPLGEHGLTWGELAGWWIALSHGAPTRQHAARDLYSRLSRSLANDAEKFFFKIYCTRYAQATGSDVPALVPQVYLHYDPYMRSRFGYRPGQLKRQRMDFLLLLPRRARVVLEIDGVQHYSRDGVPDPKLYAEMVAEDRALRLARYEVYRFGGHELARGNPRRRNSTRSSTSCSPCTRRHSLRRHELGVASQDGRDDCLQLDAVTLVTTSRDKAATV